MQLVDGKATRFVEARLSDTTISPALLCLRRKFPGVDAVQVLRKEGIDRAGELGVRLVSADLFLRQLAV